MKKLLIMIFFFSTTITSAPVFSADMIDFGAMWKGWGVEGENAYLWGFSDGRTTTIMTLTDEIISSRVKVPHKFIPNIEKKTSYVFDENRLREVITNLYKNPTNSYIWIGDMVLIARDSLNGTDVSDALLKARKAAIATMDNVKKK